MRPIRLEIRGFTAFREPQVVDFEGLDLFAITGPTGSGKSSILDALTFVLYGRAERVGDGVRQLVSQGAAAGGGRPRVRGRRRAVPGGPERDRRRQDEDPRRAVRLDDRVGLAPGRGRRRSGPRGRRDPGEARRARLRRVHPGGPPAPGSLRRVPGRRREDAAEDPGRPARPRPVRADRREGRRAGPCLGGEVTARAGILEAEYAEATATGSSWLAASWPTPARWPPGWPLRARRSRASWPARRRSSASSTSSGRLGAEAGQGAEKARRSWRPRSGPWPRRSPGRSRATRPPSDAPAEAPSLPPPPPARSPTPRSPGATPRPRRPARAGASARRRTGDPGRASGRGREPGSPRVEPAEAQALAATAAAAEAAEREERHRSRRARGGRGARSARAADRIAAIVAGLAIGDPCPVCGRPLEPLADRHGAPELKAAESTLERARVAAAEAAAACRRAERAATEAAGRARARTRPDRPCRVLARRRDPPARRDRGDPRRRSWRAPAGRPDRRARPARDRARRAGRRR